MSILDVYKSTYGSLSGGTSSGTSGGSSFATGLGTPSKVQTGLASSSRERGAPERFDLNAPLKGVDPGFDVGKVPLQALEVAGKAPGFVYERPIATAAALLGIKASPQTEGPAFGVPILGDLLNFGAEVIGNVSSIPSAAMNSGFVDLLRRYGTADDSTIINLGSRGGKEGIFAWNGKTVRELKEEARKRQFTAQEISEIVAGTKGDFDFGDHPTSSDVTADTLWRLASDPWNLLLGTGVVTGAIKGVGTLLKLQKLGVVGKAAVSATMGAEALARGEAAVTTVGGLTKFLANTYRKGAIGLTAAEMGIYGVGEITGFNQDDPKGGMVHGFFELNKAAVDNRPLSDNAAFSIWSAFHFPVIKPVKGAVAKVSEARAAAVGGTARAAVREAIGGDAAVLRMGGEEAFNDLLYHVYARKAFEEVKDQPWFMAAFDKVPDSIDEAILKSDVLNHTIETLVADRVKKGTYKADAVVQSLKDWHQSRSGVAKDVIFPWAPEDAVTGWMNYREAARKTTDAYMARRDVVIGLSNEVSAERIASFRALFKMKAVDGMVPVRDVRSFLSAHPVILDGINDTGRQASWFRGLLNPEWAGKSVPLRSLETRLKAMESKFPKIRELTHESADFEKKAPVDVDVVDGRQIARQWKSEGTAAVSVSRWRAGEYGAISSTDDVMRARNRAEVATAEDNLPLVLNDAGFEIDGVSQAIGAFERNKEPALEIISNTSTLEDLRRIAALTGKKFDQDSTIVSVSGRELDRLALEANGVEILWIMPRVDRARLEQVSKLLDEHFAGYTISDSTGLVRVTLKNDWIPDNLEQSIAQVEEGLNKLWPADLVGDTGVRHSINKAYVEEINKAGGDYTYGEVLQRARKDGRTHAFNAESSALEAGSARVGQEARRRSRLLRSEAPNTGQSSLRSYSPFELGGIGVVDEATRLTASPDYMYHYAGNEGHLRKLAVEGLRPEVHFGGKWTDGGTDKRVAFLSSPAEGFGSIRVARAGQRIRESFGEPYVTKRITPDMIEVLDQNGQWHKLSTYFEPALGVPYPGLEEVHRLAVAEMERITTARLSPKYADQIRNATPNTGPAGALNPDPRMADANIAVVEAAARGMGLTPDEFWESGFFGIDKGRSMFAARRPAIGEVSGRYFQEPGGNLVTLIRKNGENVVGRQGQEAVQKVPGGRWLSDTRAELVPIDFLEQLPGGNRLGKTDLAELRADIEANGFNEAIPLTYATNGTILRDEGNHRLAVAKELGYTAIPVRFVRTSLPIQGGFKVPGKAPNEHGYVPADLKPSDIGVPSLVKGGNIVDEGLGGIETQGVKDVAPPSSPEDLASVVTHSVAPQYRRAVLENSQPPPEFVAAGMHEAAPLVEVPLSDGRVLFVPGGFEGEWSLWDAWRLKAQMIDPETIPEAARVQLYTKLYRSQARALTDPLDTWNRTQMAILSGSTPLLNNEAGAAILRVTNLKELEQKIANATPDELMKRLKDAGIVYPAQKVEALISNAKKFVEDPEYFILQPGEDLLQYSERIMSSIDGSEMKVGNFAPMLGDPIAHPRGTMDSRMVERLIREGRIPKDVADRLTVIGENGKKTYKAPRADKLEALVGRGKLRVANPDIPEHLRNLKYKRKDGAVFVFGGDYKVLSDALDKVLHEQYPGVPFHSGGGQWFLWDMERGIFEPHTSVWPEAYKLPPMPKERILEGRAAHVEAGYFGMAEKSERLLRPIVPGAKGKWKVRELTESPGFDLRHGIFWQEATGVTDVRLRGMTMYNVNETGRALIAISELADATTIPHEIWHLRMNLATPEETALLKRYLGDDFQEPGAQMFEKYLASGQSPIPELQPIFSRFKQWILDVYRNIKGTSMDKHLSPEVAALFDKWLTPHMADEASLSARAAFDLAYARKMGGDQAVEGRLMSRLYDVTMVADEHQVNLEAFQDELAATELALEMHRMQAKEFRSGQVRWNIARDEEVSAEIPVPKYDGTLDNKSPEWKAEMAEFENNLKLYMPGYTLKAPPNAAIFYREGQGAIMDALKERTALGDFMAKHHSWWGWFDWLVSPASNAEMKQTARAALTNQLIPLGAKPKEVSAFYQRLHDLAAESKIAKRTDKRWFNSPTALPQPMIEQAAREIFSEKVVTAIDAQGGFARLVDRAHNRFIRSVDEKGIQANTIEQALNRVYSAWQGSIVGDTTRLVSKTLYPIFRFYMDPRWWAMNMLEADVLGGLRYGPRATRLGGPADKISTPAWVHEHGGVLPTGGTHTVGATKKVLADDTGWLYNRNTAGIISRAFDVERPESTLGVLKALEENDPVLMRLKERFGTEDEDLVAGIDKMLYSFDQHGTKKTIYDEARAILGDDVVTTPGMAGVLEKIYEANDATYKSIIKVFRGNPDRRNIERILNSYWLFWPLSYQVKAGKWLVDIMTHKAFGKNTNMAGAATYAQLVGLHRKWMSEDEDYAQIFEDHPELFFASQMMFPITPGDVGVSLSRLPRYVGGELGLWGKYKAAEDPLTAAGALLNMGPFYTLSLAKSIQGELDIQAPWDSGEASSGLQVRDPFTEPMPQYGN